MFRTGGFFLALFFAVPATATSHYDFYKHSCDIGLKWGCYEWLDAAGIRAKIYGIAPPVIAAFDPFAVALAGPIRQNWSLLVRDREKLVHSQHVAAQLRTCEHGLPTFCHNLEKTYLESGNFAEARRLTETLCTGSQFWWERSRACRLYGYELFKENRIPEALRVLDRSCRDREVESCLFLGIYFRRLKAEAPSRHAFRMGCRLGSDHACLAARPRRPASNKPKEKRPNIFQFGSHRFKLLAPPGPKAKNPSNLMFSAPSK